ncbi:multiple antibiotic resistance protein MarB [Klebsiella pneumoniae]|uniref:Multiple antibiotic resistance protein MarB n=1 Tax=Klebsiella pneumoniae TaxID=573 RepID=A0A2X1RIS2_KLEPN|nr:multiple antibiotic resistance protein MarB [Klebsiella pneumoniae]
MMLIACTIKDVLRNHETIRCRSYRTLSLASSLSYADQNTTPVRQNQRDTMIIPSEHNDSPFDFNHMAAGNDKSDELGVPYYQQHDL